MGHKMGMTQVYSEDGRVLPVTVINVGGNTVLRVKTQTAKMATTLSNLVWAIKATKEPINQKRVTLSGLTPKTSRKSAQQQRIPLSLKSVQPWFRLNCFQ